ncbi:hypothetical protein HAX54_024409, partial [Datura stramonium]|nr:hypothetical protein [Datura stramonium]
SATDGPPVVLRESPVMSWIDMPNIACWHHSSEYRCFTDQDQNFIGGVLISRMFPPGYCLRSVIHRFFANLHQHFTDGSPM